MASEAKPHMTCKFPGGNIVVDKTEDNHIFLRQDQRGSTEPWFYWYFAVHNPPQGTLHFHFTDWDVIGQLGPAVSTDHGYTWSWLGRVCVDGQSFTYDFPIDSQEVRFCFCIPYTTHHLTTFLKKSPAIRQEAFTQTHSGRDVPRLHAGDAHADHCLLLTARHHCCETSASYVLEGILETLVTDAYAHHFDIAAIPFMDADGVEAGDQGKCRHPHDHNRDYVGQSIYAETDALRRWFPQWSKDRPTIALDLHCPWIRGEWNEKAYLVGSPYPHIRPAQKKFMSHLAATSQDTPHPIAATNYLPYGQNWNVLIKPLTELKSFGCWAAEQPNVTLTGTLEIPYAAIDRHPVSPTSLRKLGQAIAQALIQFKAHEE